jgi:hypothetical protein
MGSSEEIKVKLEAKRRGLNADEFNGFNLEDIFQITQVPYEWTGNSYLFDFDSIPIDTLADYIYYIFRQEKYSLEEGALLDGIYFKLNISGISLFYLIWEPSYQFRVKIYSDGSKTYLEISKVFRGLLMSFYKKLFGDNYPNSELNRIVDKIKHLKPSVTGYLICNQCGGYFELHIGESADDYNPNCECGGTLKYISNIAQPEMEMVEKIKTDNTRYYLNIFNNLNLNLSSAVSFYNTKWKL